MSESESENDNWHISIYVTWEQLQHDLASYWLFFRDIRSVFDCYRLEKFRIGCHLMRTGFNTFTGVRMIF